MKLRQTVIATALWCLAATPALAGDARILTRLYKPDEVVVVDGRAGVQAAIAFGEQEQIENVAIGDSTSWQVTPNKRANLLFVKPLGARNRTNMTVVTDRHTYLFDLVAGSVGAPVYVLRFTSPAEPKAIRQVAGAMSMEEAQAAASPPKEVTAVEPPQLNFEWRADGDRRILPSRIYDDGDATFLTWPARSGIPAILTRNEKGEEGAVNYAVRGEVLVLDSVPKVIVLRSGRGIATLENLGKPRNVAPLPPVAGTTAPPQREASLSASLSAPERQ